MNTDSLRPVGMLENLYTARQVLGIYNSVVVTVTYTILTDVEDALLQDIFRVAISRVLNRHPSLCCYVEGKANQEPVFRRLEAIVFDDVFQIRNLGERKSLTEELQDFHDQRWPFSQKPLWKLVVLKDPSTHRKNHPSTTVNAAFVYHHVIGDGLSGAAFHTSLLKEIERLGCEKVQELPSSIITPPTSITLIDPIENLCTFPLSWTFLAKQVFQEYGPKWLVKVPKPPWPGLPTQPISKLPLRSRIRVITIDADSVRTLLQESKNRNVTFTSLLTATTVSTLAKAVPDANRFLGMTAYTLRRWTKTPITEMVNQISVFETNYPSDVLARFRTIPSMSVANQGQDGDHGYITNFWKTATEFQKQMQSELAQCPRDNPIGLLPYISNYIQYYEKKIGRPREITFEVSNLGVFDPSQASTRPSGWKIENIIFTQGAQSIGPAIAVNCASVLGGPLTLAITWQEGVVKESVVEALALRFQELVRYLDGESSGV